MRKITKVPKYFSRVFYQLRPMLKILTPKQKFFYLFFYLKNIKEIFLTGRFLIPDSKIIKKIKNLKIIENDLIIPIDKIESILNDLNINDNCSLELVREIFLNNEYLRFFKNQFHPQTILDIGANRGFFSLLALKKYMPQKIIKVEPLNYTRKIFEEIIKTNLLNKSSIKEYYASCSADTSKDQKKISINDIIIFEKISVIDLIKIDIEGAEIDIFSKDLSWLDNCNNITMELHFFSKDPIFIANILHKKGFKLKTSNLEEIEKPLSILKNDPRRCCYLYASKNNQLK